MPGSSQQSTLVSGHNASSAKARHRSVTRGQNQGGSQLPQPHQALYYQSSDKRDPQQSNSRATIVPKAQISSKSASASKKDFGTVQSGDPTRIRVNAEMSQPAHQAAT